MLEMTEAAKRPKRCGRRREGEEEERVAKRVVIESSRACQALCHWQGCHSAHYKPKNVKIIMKLSL